MRRWRRWALRTFQRRQSRAGEKLPTPGQAEDFLLSGNQADLFLRCLPTSLYSPRAQPRTHSPCSCAPRGARRGQGRPGISPRQAGGRGGGRGSGSGRWEAAFGRGFQVKSKKTTGRCRRSRAGGARAEGTLPHPVHFTGNGTHPEEGPGGGPDAANGPAGRGGGRRGGGLFSPPLATTAG